jgi:exopolyphosphatase / guanosine-5'-triphosphate,3'-diphosphate pyrophosphatase
MTGKIAIIDMGTNTFHLLIAEENEKGYHIVYRDRLAVKIGKGGINQGYITNDGIDRAILAMQNFKEVLDRQGVQKTFAFGTSALRNAKNGEEIVRKIKESSGITTTIISGDLEAQYIYFGIRNSLSMGEEKSLIVDIGGGSVECIIGNHDKIFWKQSFEIGAQRLLERFHKHDPITAEEINQVEKYFDQHLNSLLQSLQNYKPTALIGASGTFDTLSEIFSYKQNIRISSEQTETPLTLSGFYEVYQELIHKNRPQRMAIPGMIEMRVDMSVVAVCLIKYILSKHSFERIRVSTYSLKEGVLASLAEKGIMA